MRSLRGGAGGRAGRIRFVWRSCRPTRAYEYGSTDGYIPPCIPTRAHKVPSGPDWVHEIKHDGYRLQVRRDGDAVRLFTRRGFDWSARHLGLPHRGEAQGQVVHDCGEAVVCGPDGIAIFEALHRRGLVSELMLYGGDLTPPGGSHPVVCRMSIADEDGPWLRAP